MSHIGAVPQYRAGTRPGFAALAAKSVDGITQIADLAQFSPLRLLFPRVPEDEPLTACLSNTAGGVVGGDILDVEIVAMDGVRVLAMGQAAEKIYRSAGETARLGVTLSAGRNAWLEWLPQETILFEGSKLARQTRIEIASSARCLAGEILIFGRTAHGESLSSGSIRDAIEIRRDGRPIWADAFQIDGNLRAPLDHAAAFAGARATGLAILHAPDPSTHRDALRELAVPEGVRFGATVVAGLLIARWLAWDTQAMRRHYAGVWALLRSAAGGLAARMPPLWNI